ncbi:MAG: DMT family transporter [Gammaproteobacteria bacterium]|nr:DMT family transporter [Gammaproteobacteria bacterium]
MTAAGNVPLGIGLMITGTFMLTCQDAVSKWLIDGFHAGEILFYRGLFAYLPIAVFAWRAGGLQALRSARPRANVLRALCNTAAGFTVISAYAFMPLADAMAILFASPILVTALSVPLLGEPVGPRRWAAVLVGFAGVLLILEPSGGGLAWYLLLPIAGAVFVCFRDILTRKLGAVDGPTVILFYTVTASVIGGAASMLVLGAHWPSPASWAVFAAMGLLNGVAHYLTIKAFSLASAVTLSPLRYLSLVWAGIIGYSVWGDVPAMHALLGASLVVASGLYIFMRETRLRGLRTAR